MEEFLAAHPEPNLRVLVIWEPILPSDRRPPGRAALARISDPRTRQFWDPDHRVAQEVARQAVAHPLPPPPGCCFDSGFHWDEALLYRPGGSWNSDSGPLFWGGPVYKSMPGLETAFGPLATGSTRP